MDRNHTALADHVEKNKKLIILAGSTPTYIYYTSTIQGANQTLKDGELTP